MVDYLAKYGKAFGTMIGHITKEANKEIKKLQGQFTSHQRSNYDIGYDIDKARRTLKKRIGEMTNDYKKLLKKYGWSK